MASRAVQSGFGNVEFRSESAQIPKAAKSKEPSPGYVHSIDKDMDTAATLDVIHDCCDNCDLWRIMAALAAPNGRVVVQVSGPEGPAASELQRFLRSREAAMAKDGSGRCGQTFLGASKFSRTVYRIVHTEYSSSKLYVVGIEPGVLADAMKVLRIAVRGIFTKEMYSDLAYLSPLEAIQMMCEAEPDRARLSDRLHAAEQELHAPRRPDQTWGAWLAHIKRYDEQVRTIREDLTAAPGGLGHMREGELVEFYMRAHSGFDPVQLAQIRSTMRAQEKVQQIPVTAEHVKIFLANAFSSAHLNRTFKAATTQLEDEELVQSNRAATAGRAPAGDPAASKFGPAAEHPDEAAARRSVLMQLKRATAQGYEAVGSQRDDFKRIFFSATRCMAAVGSASDGGLCWICFRLKSQHSKDAYNTYCPLACYGCGAVSAGPNRDRRQPERVHEPWCIVMRALRPEQREVVGSKRAAAEVALFDDDDDLLVYRVRASDAEVEEDGPLVRSKAAREVEAPVVGAAWEALQDESAEDVPSKRAAVAFAECDSVFPVVDELPMHGDGHDGHGIEAMLGAGPRRRA
jgi:hypothetical protein